MEVFHWRTTNVAVGQITNCREVGELHYPVKPARVQHDVECTRRSKVNPQNGAWQSREHILDLATIAINQHTAVDEATQFSIVLAGVDRS